MSSEIVQVLKDNAQLSELNAALREGNTALKDANAALQHLVTSLQNERALLLLQSSRVPQVEDSELGSDVSSGTELHEAALNLPTYTATKLSYNRLPYEILLRIFQATIPHPDVCDYSLQTGPRGTWITSHSTRKALVIVCQAWYTPASEALYTEVVLRRVGQICALARTLRATGVVFAQNPRRYIKSIRLDSCISLAALEDAVKSDLAYILRECTFLKSFTWSPHPSMAPSASVDGEGDLQQWYTPTWIWDAKEGTPGSALATRCSKTLRELEMVCELDEARIMRVHNLLSRGSHLTTLLLGHTLLADPQAEDFLTLPRINLPHLEELQIDVISIPFTQYVCKSWNLPNLKRLTLLQCSYFPEDVLEAHGSNLEYLHLVPAVTPIHMTLKATPWPPTDIGHLRDIHELCPRLIHLVIPELPHPNPHGLIESPTLLYLDMWSSQPRTSQRFVELMTEMARESYLPALQAIRMLPFTDFHSLPIRLPLICNPGRVHGDQSHMWTFPRTRVLQTSWALFTDSWSRGGLLFADDPWGDDSEASEGIESDEDEDASADEAVEGEFRPESDDWRDDTSWITDSEDGSEYPDDSTQADVHRLREADDTDVEEDTIEPYPQGPIDREVILEAFSRGQEEEFLFDDD